MIDKSYFIISGFQEIGKTHIIGNVALFLEKQYPVVSCYVRNTNQSFLPLVGTDFIALLKNDHTFILINSASDDESTCQELSDFIQNIYLPIKEEGAVERLVVISSLRKEERLKAIFEDCIGLNRANDRYFDFHYDINLNITRQPRNDKITRIQYIVPGITDMAIQILKQPPFWL